MAMTLADMENDPIVKQTVKVYQDALAGDDFGSRGGMYSIPPVEEMPGVKALLDADALDPVCAAVLSVGPLSQIVDLDDIESKLDPRVVDTLRLFNGDNVEGPEDLVASGNPHVLKLLIATVAAATGKDELKEMTAYADMPERKMMVTELSDLILALSEKLLETNGLKDIPPKLMDKFFESIDNLSSVTPSRTHKFVLSTIKQQLKEGLAKAEAVEITAPAPVIDPDSPFVQLKNNARKFKPGGMNG